MGGVGGGGGGGGEVQVHRFLIEAVIVEPVIESDRSRKLMVSLKSLTIQCNEPN